MSKQPSQELNFKQRLKKILFRCVIALTIAIIFAMAGSYFGYQKYVVASPGDHISSKYIQSIMTQESPILYKGGEELGMLYENKYRIYIPYKNIPKGWVHALVAVEDQFFYDHHGINLYNIVGSMVANIKAGRIVRGGSTLTQQTAKNLYNRGKRVEENQIRIAEYLKEKERLKQENRKQVENINLVAKIEAKLWEMLNALRLDYHHSKEDILEYYANQIPIRGQGTGIAIAAKYFFDKEVKDLTLHECIFLAIIPKGPENYNPFTGVREEKIEKISGRMQAALNNMVEMGYLTEDQRDELYFKELQFKHGKFHFERNMLIDIVKQELQEPHIQQALLDAGITNPDTSGIHIVTTIDHAIQTDAIYYFRNNLSRLTLRTLQYEGKSPKTLHRYVEYGTPFMEQPPKKHHFYDAKVIAKKEDSLELNIKGHTCIVDKSGLDNIAKFWKKKRSGVLASIRERGVLYVSVREEGICDIEFEGDLTGGFLVVNKGNIIALVGSPSNKHSVIEHDRTGVYKKESGPLQGKPFRVQLGSTWKTVILASALQLGWTPSDHLDNYNNMFKYSTTYYFPRADHIPKTDTTPMQWAGAMSENRASVWLLSHLTEKLSFEQKKELAEKVGLTRQEGESKREYKKRLGLDIRKVWIPSLAFEKAKEEVLLEMSDGEQKTNVISLEHRPDFDEEKAKEVIARSYQIAGKGKRAKWRKNHQEEVLNHRYDVFKEQIPSCVDAYEDLEKWHKKSSIRENFPTLKNIFQKVREETSSDEESKDGKLNLFQRKKDSVQENTTQNKEQNKEENIVNPEATKRQLFPPPELPSQVVEKLWYNTKTKKIGCGIPKSSLQAHHQELHKEMFFPTEDNLRDPIQQETNDDTIKNDLKKSTADAIHLKKVPNLWVNDRISLNVLQKIQDRMKRYKPYFQTVDLHSLEALLYHRDFVQQMNMKYIEYSMQRLGINQSFDNLVLSMTLGAVEVSLAEMANVYSSLMRGRQYLTESKKTHYIIDSIYDNQGKLIYKTKVEEDVVSDEAIGTQLANVLHSALHYGTGKTPWKYYPTKLNDFDVPSLGKTGTTQGSQRMAFIGMVPSEYAGQWSLNEGYVMASYIGYDTPTTIRKGSGGSANLPFWLRTAQSLSDNGHLGSLERAVPWKPMESDTMEIPFDRYTGSIITSEVEENTIPTIWTSTKSTFLDIHIHRIFAPLEKEGPPNIRELKKQTIMPKLDEKIKGLFPSQVEDTGIENINFFIQSEEKEGSKTDPSSEESSADKMIPEEE